MTRNSPGGVRKATIDDAETQYGALADAPAKRGTAFGIALYLFVMFEAYRYATGHSGAIAILLESLPIVQTLPYRPVFWATLVIEGVLALAALNWLARSPWKSSLRHSLRGVVADLLAVFRHIRSERTLPDRARLIGLTQAGIALAAGFLLALDFGGALSLPGIVPVLGLIAVPVIAVGIGGVLVALFLLARRDKYTAAATILAVVGLLVASAYAPSPTAAFSRAACLTDSALAIAGGGGLSPQTRAAMRELYGQNWRTHTGRKAPAAVVAQDGCTAASGTLVDLETFPTLREIDPDLTDLRIGQGMLFVLLLAALIFSAFRNKGERVVIEVGSSTLPHGSQRLRAVLDPTDLIFHEEVQLKFRAQDAGLVAFERPRGEEKFRPVSTTNIATRVPVDESILILWNLKELDHRLSQTREIARIPFFSGTLSYKGRALPSLVAAFGDNQFSADELSAVQELMVQDDNRLVDIMHEQFEATLQDTLADIVRQLGEIETRIVEVAGQETDPVAVMIGELGSAWTIYQALDRESREALRLVARHALLNDALLGLQKVITDANARSPKLDDISFAPAWPDKSKAKGSVRDWWAKRTARELGERAGRVGEESIAAIGALWSVIGPDARATLTLAPAVVEMKANLEAQRAEAKAQADEAHQALKQRLAEAGTANTVTLADQTKMLIDLLSNPRISSDKVLQAFRSMHQLTQTPPPPEQSSADSAKRLTGGRKKPPTVKDEG